MIVQSSRSHTGRSHTLEKLWRLGLVLQLVSGTPFLRTGNIYQKIPETILALFIIYNNVYSMLCTIIASAEIWCLSNLTEITHISLGSLNPSHTMFDPTAQGDQTSIQRLQPKGRAQHTVPGPNRTEPSAALRFGARDRTPRRCGDRDLRAPAPNHSRKTHPWPATARSSRPRWLMQRT
jgi:hypothetical protein